MRALCRFQEGDRAKVGLVVSPPGADPCSAEPGADWRVHDLAAVGVSCLAEALAGAEDPARVTAWEQAPGAQPSRSLPEVRLLAPIDEQELWGAGVTYERSLAGRTKESDAAASCYDHVYTAPRPELFFKANPCRVRGPGEPVRIRRDSRWDVPEPELTLALSPGLRLVGYTCGNDLSSRDLEGENPLYLPQAKIWDGCAALGPWIVPAWEVGEGLRDARIELVVRRGDRTVATGETQVGRMRRSLDELIAYLGREASFPRGAFLMTGTGIVPEPDFSLEPGDEVSIVIEGIGRLTNPVERLPEAAL